MLDAGGLIGEAADDLPLLDGGSRISQTANNFQMLHARGT